MPSSRGGAQFNLVGTGEVSALAARLKAVGRDDLRKELLVALRTAAAPAREAVAQSAHETLPKRGGYAALISTEISAPSRSRISGITAQVRITATDKSRPNRDLKALDEGELRHPVYGNREVWRTTHITPGFFTRPMLKLRGPAVRQITAAVASIARRIAA